MEDGEQEHQEEEARLEPEDQPFRVGPALDEARRRDLQGRGGTVTAEGEARQLSQEVGEEEDHQGQDQVLDVEGPAGSPIFRLGIL